MLEIPQVTSPVEKVSEFQENDKSTRNIERARVFVDLINESVESIRKHHKNAEIILGKDRFNEGGFSFNYKHGVSVYCYLRVGISEIKICISDHVGRWSGYNVDLRNPKDSEIIVRSIMSQVK